MLAVTAQANTCDPQNEGTPDNAKKQSNTKPAATEKNAADRVPSNQVLETAGTGEPDPSALAARILQLTAANDTPLTPRPKKPELLCHDDEPLDIPDVLVTRTGDDWTPNARQRQKGREMPARYGPSFKALFASTVLLAIAGSGAIALGLPDLMSGGDTDVLEVQTEVITTGPVQDRSSDGPLAASPSVTSPAKPKQIEKAKDRIRQAFAETAPRNPGSNLRTDKPRAASETAGLITPPTKDGALEPSLAAGAEAPETAAVLDTEALPSPDTTVLPAAASVPGENAARTAAAEATLAGQDNASTDTSSDPSSGNTAVTPNTGIVTASVNLRQSDDKNGKIIGVLPQGTEVQYSICGKWWCAVDHNGKSGFVGEKFIRR